MKKSIIVPSVLCALFLVGSVSLFSQGSTAVGVFGLVVSSALGVIGYMQFKKYKAAIIQSEKARVEAEERSAREKAEAEEKRRTWNDTHGVEMFSVAGVTFNNDDGGNRQTILKRKLKEFNCSEIADVSLEEYDYQGKPAIHVLLDGECIGNIKASEISKVLDFEKRGITGLSYFIESFEDEDEKTIYSCSLTITYEK